MSDNPHANGGQLLKDLRMPNFCEYAVEVLKPGTIEAEATRVMLSPEAAVIDVDGSALQRIKRRVIIEAYIELLARVRDGDVVITMGAGSIGAVPGKLAGQG